MSTMQDYPLEADGPRQAGKFGPSPTSRRCPGAGEEAGRVPDRAGLVAGHRAHEPQAHGRPPFWYMWKLPMFGETSAEKVLAEAEACHKANPLNHVRLVGYDKAEADAGHRAWSSTAGSRLRNPP